jgi:hypothetical protein
VVYFKIPLHVLPVYLCFIFKWKIVLFVVLIKQWFFKQDTHTHLRVHSSERERLLCVKMECEVSWR